MPRATTYSIRRVEALTDGVFAIAMTLIVLELKVPVDKTIHSNGQLWHLLTEQGTTFLNFLISFAALAAMWNVHQRQFDVIDRVDSRLVALNHFRLLAVILVPFTVSLSSNYSDLTLGAIGLPLNYLLLALTTYVQWRYAARAEPRLLSPEVTAADIRRGDSRSLGLAGLSILVTILTFWLHSYALIAFALTPLAMRISDRLMGERGEVTGDAAGAVAREPE